MKYNYWAVPAEESFYLNDSTHVWLFSLKIAPDELKNLERHLNQEDMDRANRFKFAIHRHKFIAAHGKLNFILGNYLKQQPSRIRFIKNEYGKPFVRDNPLFFNLSHSGELGILAVSKRFEVGVDIEYIRPEFAELKIAKRFFSENEVNELMALPAEQQKPGFFNCWSRKEAYIKGQGKGLSIPLHLFDVSLAPDKPARLLDARDDPSALKRWRLIDLEAHPEYAAALLVHRRTDKIKLWNGDKLSYSNPIPVHRKSKAEKNR